MMPHEDKQMKFNTATVRRLLTYVSGTYKLRFTSVLLFILISAAAGVAGSLFLEILIDDYIGPLLGTAAPDFTSLLWAIGMMGIIYLTGVISTYVYNRQMVVIGQGVQKSIRDEMFTKMQKLPVRYFDSNSFGDIMSRYTNDIDTLRQMISQSIPSLFSSLATIVMVFGAMLFSSIWLTLLVVAVIAVMLKVSGTIAGKSGRYFFRQQEDLGDINGYIEEMMNGQKVVKVFCHEADSNRQFDDKSERLFESGFLANKYAAVVMPVMLNLGNLAYVLVAVAGGAMALGDAGGFTLGAIASFLQLTKSFNQPLSQISQQINSVIMALAGADRIFALMDEPPEQDDGYVMLVNGYYDEQGSLTEAPGRTGLWAWKYPYGDGTTTYSEVKGDLIFDGVSFGYGEEKEVLHEVSLLARPGEKIAFVGATGAGKTTITNLLNRFYDIDSGTIRYDGININKIKKSDLRRSLGIVLQETNLFTGTVMDNIRYGRLEATDSEVVAAAKLAGADSFIRRLPDGYHTVLTGDGSGLSQGQRQLLAIARAAAADPPVMILDEATSSIDTRTEKLVQCGMDALMEGRTVLAIAHRLSTIQNAEAIMVMEKGEIIERGSHDQLIEKEGWYRRLYLGNFETADEMTQDIA